MLKQRVQMARRALAHHRGLAVVVALVVIASGGYTVSSQDPSSMNITVQTSFTSFLAG
jgi:hypothetical protein